MILGLDISTSITGFAVIADGALVYYDSIDLRKHKSVFAKTIEIKEKLMDIYEVYQCDNDSFIPVDSEQPIEHIYIEQPFTFFNSGGSSAKTMATLQRFNGIVSWLCYEVFDLQPAYIAATSARKKSGIAIPRGSKAKQIVIQYIIDNVPDVLIEYTKHGNPKPQCYDMADSWVIAYAGWLSCLKKEN